MRTALLYPLLMATIVAGCMPALPYAECGVATAEECRLVVNAALDVLEDPPKRLIVGGAGPGFVVIGCTSEDAVVVDARVGQDSSVEATLRDGGPNMAHLCLEGAPPP